MRVGSSGGISENEHTITIVNERSATANVMATVNNWKTMTADIQDKTTFTTLFRQGGNNEIQVASNGTVRSFFCSGDSTIYLTEDGSILWAARTLPASMYCSSYQLPHSRCLSDVASTFKYISDILAYERACHRRRRS